MENMMVTLHAGRVSWNSDGQVINLLLEVTLHAGRVSWNDAMGGGEWKDVVSRSTRGVWVEITMRRSFRRTQQCHAPRGACELKFDNWSAIILFSCHAPRGACELKWPNSVAISYLPSVTLHAGRVSWNVITLGKPSNIPCHAPRGVSWNYSAC